MATLPPENPRSLMHSMSERTVRFGPRVLPSTTIRPSSLALPMPHMPSALARKPAILFIRPFLIRLSKDESAKITLVFSRNAFARSTASSKSMPSRASLSISRTQRTSSGPVERESSTAIFLSGSASSAKSRAVRALFMLPESCDEMVMAMVRSAFSNCSSHAPGAGHEV